MIRVVRPEREPQELTDARTDELPKLRELIRNKASGEVIKKHINGYRVVGEALWRAQHSKCCYCEKEIEVPHNDVEHYRPKLEAHREPGSHQTYGYWWLAFTWENLLFACSTCNRSAKGRLFPLQKGSKPLVPEAHPPGDETPLALDPANEQINPVEHIEFHLHTRIQGGKLKWYARARDNSELGQWSIEKVYDLNRQGLLELRTRYVENHVESRAQRLRCELKEKKFVEAKRSFDEAMALLRPSCIYVALTYDALRHYVPNSELRPLKKSWPKPKDVGLSNAQRPIIRRRQDAG